jgi:hypothetical protein
MCGGDRGHGSFPRGKSTARSLKRLGPKSLQAVWDPTPSGARFLSKSGTVRDVALLGYQASSRCDANAIQSENEPPHEWCQALWLGYARPFL